MREAELMAESWRNCFRLCFIPDTDVWFNWLNMCSALVESIVANPAASSLARIFRSSKRRTMLSTKRPLTTAYDQDVFLVYGHLFGFSQLVCEGFRACRTTDGTWEGRLGALKTFLQLLLYQKTCQWVVFEPVNARKSHSGEMVTIFRCTFRRGPIKTAFCLDKLRHEDMLWLPQTLGRLGAEESVGAWRSAAWRKVEAHLTIVVC